MVTCIMQRYKVFSSLEYDAGDTKSYGNERFGMRGKNGSRPIAARPKDTERR